MSLHTRTTGPRNAPRRGPVLFVHGFPFDGEMWSQQLDALPGGWLGLAPDLRGFGGSDLVLPPADLPTEAAAGAGVTRDGEPVLTMDRHADDLAALLRDRGGEPAVVCGLSMGGYVALALHRRHPDLVRALVLVDTRAEADTADARENRRRMAETVRERGVQPVATAMLPSLLAERTLEERGEVVERVREMILATPPATLIAALAGMAARPDSTPDLPDLGVPALVCVGEHDALTPPELARGMADAIPGARLEVIPGAGHLAPLENPAGFDDALHRFLAELD